MKKINKKFYILKVIEKVVGSGVGSGSGAGSRSTSQRWIWIRTKMSRIPQHWYKA
jgi:hypothetical protein